MSNLATLLTSSYHNHACKHRKFGNHFSVAGTEVRLQRGYVAGVGYSGSLHANLDTLDTRVSVQVLDTLDTYLTSRNITNSLLYCTGCLKSQKYLIYYLRTTV